jgi:hypothetical protein
MQRRRHSILRLRQASWRWNTGDPGYFYGVTAPDDLVPKELSDMRAERSTKRGASAISRCGAMTVLTPRRALPAAEASRLIARTLMSELQDFKEGIDGG